eukprot:8333809-Lingulodinium_polyedra.AAC.1
MAAGAPAVLAAQCGYATLQFFWAVARSRRPALCSTGAARIACLQFPQGCWLGRAAFSRWR